jgi:saccharopine dehydrogenase-like NADP-dependent oxidoreductase
MKHILLFGAGKSATVLIDYLKIIADEKNWKVVVADASLTAATSKTGLHKLVTPIEINIENKAARMALIAQADIVISLMPPHLHYLVALDCIELGKNLLTASYIDNQTKELAEKAKEKGILFLYEMGLDPGIDHMSAMQIIHHIQHQGGNITSFISHCGGLVAPESDDNPWHYKISWNPKNVVMAGKAGATFLENGEIKNMQYEELFNPDFFVKMPDEGAFSFYPNRDSLGYINTYGLKGVETFVRTTLRHPEFSFGWKNIVDLKLTNEDKIYETNGMTIAQFFQLHLHKNGFNNWVDEILMKKLNDAKDTLEKLMQLMENEEEAIEEGISPEQTILMVDEAGKLNTIDVEEIKGTAAEHVALSMNEANLSIKQLVFLGMDDKETTINLGLCSAADVLQFILEKKLVLDANDKDMIVMLHEFEYTIGSQKKAIKSVLRVVGENNTHTAMAKTVGLPLGIAAQLILEGSIKETGLHIPILPSIYEPVLNELKKHNIIFEEFTPNIFQ